MNAARGNGKTSVTEPARMHAQALTIASLFALAALFLASCADSDEAAKGPGKPISEAQYEQQVEEGFGRITPMLINWSAPATLSGRRIAGHW
jgi:hypothetical protein